MKLLTPRFGFAAAVCILLFSFTTFSAVAQESTPGTQPGNKPQIGAQYTLGDQMLSIDLGVLLPLFYWGGPNGAQWANLTIGGDGSLQWSAFLNNNLALGLNVAGNFSFTPNSRALFLVAITPTVEYFFRKYPFEFPLSLGAGVNFSRLQDNFKTDPILRPGIGAYYDFSTSWSFGLNFQYWWIPQIYTSTALASETRYGNFLTLTLSALYHF